MADQVQTSGRWRRLRTGTLLGVVLVGSVMLARLVAPVAEPTIQPVAARAVAVAAAAPVVTSTPTGATDTLPIPAAAWVETTARRTGVPVPALVAYARASLRAPEGCGLGWTTLAGIGWVESQHGTLAGRVLAPNGVSSTPITGPALDGSGDVASVPSTPYGLTLHGDPRWDHAVGPMQFISATWQQWGADGDGDGSIDPQDVDDAAYAAALYLCADGRDLTTGAGWSAGVLSYNRAQVYLDGVFAAASVYAERAAGSTRTE